MDWATARETHPTVNLERAAHLWELYCGLTHRRNHLIETGPPAFGVFGTDWSTSGR